MIRLGLTRHGRNDNGIHHEYVRNMAMGREPRNPLLVQNGWDLWTFLFPKIWYIVTPHRIEKSFENAMDMYRLCVLTVFMCPRYLVSNFYIYFGVAITTKQPPSQKVCGYSMDPK